LWSAIRGREARIRQIAAPACPSAEGRPTMPILDMHSASLQGVKPLGSELNDPFEPLPPMPRDVLLLEDNYIIALDTEDMLLNLGIAAVRTANSLNQALDEIAAQLPDFAFLDVNVGNDKCFAVAEQLHEKGVPFAFATGYRDGIAFPAAFAKVAIVTKPYTPDGLREALLLATHRD
jgi:CheY-like chemotaxis protein